MRDNFPVVVLISGRGSNLSALIASAQSGQRFTICAVISNRADATGLALAQQAGIPTAIVDHTQFTTRTGFDQKLIEHIDAHQPKLIVMAGFMRILTPEFISHYTDRMINIHPSLLPAYPGLNTHQRVIDAGDKEHGASVHLVTEDVDGGQVLMQARVPVRTDDDATTLATRVLEQEHRILPLVIEWFAEGRLNINNGKALMDGTLLTGKPGSDPGFR